LEESRHRQLLLEDELIHSRRERMVFMQMMRTLLTDQSQARSALLGQLAAPFLALGDADAGVAEEKGAGAE
jgi:hypothetical protein